MAKEQRATPTRQTKEVVVSKLLSCSYLCLMVFCLFLQLNVKMESVVIDVQESGSRVITVNSGSIVFVLISHPKELRTWIFCAKCV